MALNPLHHPGAIQIPENDIEKRGELKHADVAVTSTGSHSPTSTSIEHAPGEHKIPPTPILLKGPLGRWNAKIESLAGLEARGVTRVLPEEKHAGGKKGYVQMFFLWFSINLTATNIITGLLGPLIFALGWKDCICIVVFAQALTACGPSYTSTFGPESGNRTMVSWEWLGRASRVYTDGLACCVDSQSLLHGLLASKAFRHPQFDHASGLGNNWLYHRRPDAVGRQWRRIDHRGRLHHLCPLHWFHCGLWHCHCPHIRAVRRLRSYCLQRRQQEADEWPDTHTSLKSSQCWSSSVQPVRTSIHTQSRSAAMPR